MSGSFPRDRLLGSTSRLSALGARQNDIPRLVDFPDTPVYDVATVMHILGVRAVTLWNWEQQLGIVSSRSGEQSNASARRYSDREVRALMWLRDEVVGGASLAEAAARLRASQNASLPSGQPAMPRRAPAVTRPLWDRSSLTGITGAPSSVTHSSGPSSLVNAGASDVRRTFLHMPGAAAADRESSSYVAELVRAFARFDSERAQQIVRKALYDRTVEQVCVRLLQPALVRVGDLWAQREMSIPEEHFAANFVRGFLFSVFHGTPERPDGPLVMVACGPLETHDIGALTLAVFWRRAGIRVIYLGQDVEMKSLVDRVRVVRPALLAVSVMTSHRLRTLARLARDVNTLPPPRTIFAYGGAVFGRHPELQRKIPGVYLGDDAPSASWHVQRLLGMEPSV